MGIGEGHTAGVGREALADDSDWLLEGASQCYIIQLKDWRTMFFRGLDSQEIHW